ncbi:MAG: hypothetical protein NXI32_14215 [bacterium]|nr:hypothetical protein [bacterium]
MSDIAFTRIVAGKQITEALSEQPHFSCCAKRMFSAGLPGFHQPRLIQPLLSSLRYQHPEVTSIQR